MNLKTFASATALAFVGLAASCFAQAPITIGVQYHGVTAIGATITGTHSNQAHVSPGAQFSVHFLYTIIDTGCPGCDDQIQVGFANALPVACAFAGNPGHAGAVGISRESLPITLTAPTTPGTYYIAIDESQSFSCPTNAWWSGTPQPNQYIAAITVF